VVAVDRRRAAREQAELPRPGERLPAIRAEMSRPRAVVGLAQGGEHLGALLAVHAEDGAEIVQGENPKATDRAQEPVRVVRVQRLQFGYLRGAWASAGTAP
jgi:hypothetical protein